MVCIMQTSAVASTFPSEKSKQDNVSRDFAGVGAGSVIAGLIGSFSVDASPASRGRSGSSMIKITDFCNKIGTTPTSRDRPTHKSPNPRPGIRPNR
jgi:hypothetical protein